MFISKTKTMMQQLIFRKHFLVDNENTDNTFKIFIFLIWLELSNKHLRKVKQNSLYQRFKKQKLHLNINQLPSICF